jgi:hypothetical protein
MVFEVISAKAPAVAGEPCPDVAPQLSAGPVPRPEPVPDGGDVAVLDRPVARPLAPGVLAQLLRSAVSLQAEGLLRTAGALSGVWGTVLDRTAWIERDARDLSALTSAAIAAGARLPAGLDAGAGDPNHPSSVVEGLLASHEALVHVLRQIAGSAGSDAVPACGAAGDPAGTTPDDDAEPWQAVVRAVLDRREEEIVLLRAVGAVGRLPPEEAYLRGRPPRHR